MEHYLDVRNLQVTFTNETDTVTAVGGVSFGINPGEIVCFVGESGSGKTVTQLALMQLIASPPGKIAAGEVWLDGVNLMTFAPDSLNMRAVRGGGIGMIFQEPMTSLNPVKTIGTQLMESILLHKRCKTDEARKRAISLLESVGIPDAESRLSNYPHQFSGGMRQRIMVAIAISGDPRIIIADEPTTALDVTMQAQILELLKETVERTGAALVLVTHNLGVVARYAQRIYVMYAGRIVESGTAGEIFAHPAHPYTRGLLAAIPRLDDPRDRRLVPIDGTPLNPRDMPKGCAFRERCRYQCEKCVALEAHPALQDVAGRDGHQAACIRSLEALEQADADTDAQTVSRQKVLGKEVLSVNGLSVRFPVRSGLLQRAKMHLTAVDDVSFSIRKGETLGLVGESGCGKTTVARSVLQLLPRETEGSIIFEGRELSSLKPEQLRRERRRIQMVFQDPYSSLDPRMRVADLVGEPLKIHKLVQSQAAYRKRVNELFELVGLDPSYGNRVAHEFSGGQRQRIGIARALACEPELIVCDEPISALDVSIQAQIINLLEDLQQRIGLTYLFIAHDLSVVKHISDRIAVMYLGQIVELADCEELYRNPLHPYTTALLSAVPIPDPAVELKRESKLLSGEVPGLLRRPKGCCFADRCPNAVDECHCRRPALLEASEGHMVACDKLMRRN